MTTPIDFTTAKLLKEKGFDEPCSHAYKEVESPVLYIHQDKKYNSSFKKEWQNTVRKNSHMDNAVIKRYSAPTIAEVVMWMYEKHGIWISVYTMETWPNGNERKQLFDYSLKQMRFGLIDISKKPEEFNSPTEAYSQAIIYTLKNLI